MQRIKVSLFVKGHCKKKISRKPNLFSFPLMILGHRWLLLERWGDVNLSLACVWTCCPWDPGDSSPPAERQDFEHYLDFLLLHLGENRQFRTKFTQKYIRKKKEQRGTLELFLQFVLRRSSLHRFIHLSVGRFGW